MRSVGSRDAGKAQHAGAISAVISAAAPSRCEAAREGVALSLGSRAQRCELRRQTGPQTDDLDAHPRKVVVRANGSKPGNVPEARALPPKRQIMRYIDESLAADETIIRRGNWPGIFWFGAWAALLLLGIIVVGVVIFAIAAIKMKTTDFAVTNRRVILKRGWLNRRTHELAVESVEGVSLDQSLIARLFGYGRVVVTGTGDAVIAFPPMADPVAFRRAIESARAESGARVRLAPEDRQAVERAAHSNENEPDEIVENQDVEEAPARRKRRPSFIGLRARR